MHDEYLLLIYSLFDLELNIYIVIGILDCKSYIRNLLDALLIVRNSIYISEILSQAYCKNGNLVHGNKDSIVDSKDNNLIDIIKNGKVISNSNKIQK